MDSLEGLKETLMETLGLRPHRQYDEQFRQRAVELYQSSGKPVRQVALELGMPFKTLARWSYMSKRKSRASSRPLDPPPQDLQQLLAENQQLRRQLAYLEEQRDILKKAIAICSTDPRFQPPSK